MEKKDYYQILGIKKSAEDREIKKAYKRLAMRYHPDRNQGDKTAEKKFKEAKEAYEILKDKDKRATYDRYGHEAFEQGNQSNNGFHSSFTTTAEFGDVFGDVFGDIFGSNTRQRKSKGADLCYNMELTLEEAVKGVIKEINIPILQKCDICYGKGYKHGSKPNTCYTCQGHGNIKLSKGFFTVQQTCPKCNGKGIVIDNPCNACKGNGRREQYKKISVKIPAGIDSNDKIRLSNEGEDGDNGAQKGDLYVQFKIKKHNIFQRKDSNLYCDIPINFNTAALGGNIEVPTLEGKIKLKIPEETQTGKLFRIRSKGVKSVRNNIKGDLICRIIVETPINLNEHQKKLISELGKTFNKTKTNKNSPQSKRFFDGVKKFFDNLTK